MRKKIRDLDLEHIVARIFNATSAEKRLAPDRLIQQNLPRESSPERAMRLVRNHIVYAIIHTHARLEDIVADEPLVHAFIRTQSHPLAGDMPVFLMDSGVDVSPRLSGFIAAHPMLTWDIDAVQADLLASIREHGDHELDDSLPPWLMHWGPAKAATPLLWFVTLKKFGDLQPKGDAWGQAVHDHELEHFERTKSIKPSSLVAPPPPRKTSNK